MWQKTCQLLKKQLNPDVYSRWIAVIKPSKFESDKLILSVGNDFYQSWLEEHYLPLIKEALCKVSGKNITVQFEVNQEILASTDLSRKQSSIFKRRISSRKSRRQNLASESSMNPKYIFDSFVVGPSNNFAHASSLAVAQAPGKAYNPLFIYGDVGLGKTHLMQAIGQYILSRSKERICYLSCETLMNEYINALQNRSFYRFRKKYRSTDVLLIDDIHFLARKDALQEEFFHTFNELFNARKQIVMTSDRPASEISGLEKRLVSRFEWGLVTELSPPDFETRVAILRSVQKTANVSLPEDVITFIASSIKSNIRRLEGAFTRVTSYAGLYHKPITLELVKQLLQVMLEQEHTEPITISSIQRRVADFYDIRISDMTGKNRSRCITEPRQIAMYLSRKMTNASLPEIGSSFDKTHATVLHACKRIDRKQEQNDELRQSISKITRQLETPA